jgi:hypothetical protein
MRIELWRRSFPRQKTRAETGDNITVPLLRAPLPLRFSLILTNSFTPLALK